MSYIEVVEEGFQLRNIAVKISKKECIHGGFHVHMLNTGDGSHMDIIRYELGVMIITRVK